MRRLTTRFVIKELPSAATLQVFLQTAVVCGFFCMTACAQTYVVSADNAVFLNEQRQPAGSISQQTEIYVHETNDGWLRTVHPDSLVWGWVSKRAVTPKRLDADARRRVSAAMDQLPAVEQTVNQNVATAAQFKTTRKWLEEIRGLLGIRHPDSVTALHYAGLVAHNARLLSDSRSLLEEALNAAKTVHGKTSDKVAELHLDLAYVLADLSQLADAAREAKAAAIIRAKRYGNQHPLTMEAFIPLAMAMESISDDESALRYYSKVLDVYTEHYGDDDVRTLKLQGRRADVASRLGKNDDAIRSYEHILKQLRSRKTQHADWIARTELKLDFLRLQKRDASDLKSFLDESDEYVRSHPRGTSFANELRRRLVSDLLDQQETSKAFQILDRTLRDLRDQLRVDLWGVEPGLQQDYLSFADGGRFYEAVGSAVRLRELRDVISLSSEWLLNGKGLVREVQAVRLGFRNNLERRDEWAQRPWVTAEDLRAALPKHSVYVDLLRFPSEAPESESEPASPAFQYAAWVTPTIGPQQLVVLGDADRIDDDIHEFRRLLLSTAVSIRKDGETTAVSRLSPILGRLSRQLWHPLVDAIGSAEKIILSPDGVTWLVPWAALQNDDGSFAVEKFELQVQVSGRNVVQSPDSQPQMPATIFADPDYGPALPREDRDLARSATVAHQVSAAALDYSAEEAAVARVALNELLNAEPNVLTGSNATEARFKSLRRPSVLMLSTHGFFADAETDSPDVDPLLRCGLLLSQANQCRDYSTLTNDGVLNGVEVMSADLLGTRLAILSACETGVGETTLVEGVTGLRSAFHLAGVHSVVSTLWSVHDRETAYLMTDFFRSLVDEETIAAALRQAQLKRIRSRRERYGAAHPYFWAAFTVSGHLRTEQLRPRP